MEGRRVPSVIFKTRVRDESVGGPNPFRWQDVRSDDLFAGRRVVVFSLPGAFTPTCSNEQCPSFDRLFNEMRGMGIDEVYCFSVNDAFVMFQWGQNLGLKNIKLIPDGNGDFTRRMGMLIRKEHLGFGYRSWRYAMVV
ncbi:MAG TPA: redoxin family protein, partial [Azospirillaceae bacterium]|nr:redoxin family protein [Azospirillaceae bacterium]